VRSQAQYRASLAVDVAGSVLFGVLDIVSVVVLFRVTPTLGGFGFAEVFLMTALGQLRLRDGRPGGGQRGAPAPVRCQRPLRRRCSSAR